MQSSGPADRPGPKFRLGRAFCGARTKGAGFMPGSGEAITMHYTLAAGLGVVLERCWPGSMLGPEDFVRCRSGLGLGFWRFFFASLVRTNVGDNKVLRHSAASSLRAACVLRNSLTVRYENALPSGIIGSTILRSLYRMTVQSESTCGNIPRRIPPPLRHSIESIELQYVSKKKTLRPFSLAKCRMI